MRMTSLLALGVALTACSSPRDRPVAICDREAPRPCACPGGTDGIQLCTEDGTMWEECRCPMVDGGAADASMPPDAAADGGGADAGAPDAGGDVCGTPCAGATSVTDADGNSYGTVAICSQCWMSRNLRVGVMGGAFEGGQHDDDRIEKFCPDDVSARCDSEGGLYQWGEMLGYSSAPGGRGICPAGWHVPTDEDWKTLEMALGMSRSDADSRGSTRGTDEGAMLRAGGSTGFDARMVGAWTMFMGRYTFLNDRSTAFFWTSTPAADNAWSRDIGETSPRINRRLEAQTAAYSVRCLRD